MKALAVVAAFTVLSPAAYASVELIHNGGFESAGGFSGGFETIGSGLDGWTIGGTVDLINTYWTPASGSYSLDLNGGGAGSISQSFATVVGQTYNVSFSLAGNPVGGGDKFFYASVNTPITYTFDIDGKTTANMGWVRRSFSFVATSDTSTLSFVGDPYHSYYGAALDDISVVAAVPEPATYGMMLVGLAMVGRLARRRK
ncbi:choice-of-anchor C family protein [Oxalobacteraceae bacterium OTU3CAMAD1]|nr:choice-of-anchor C family protein [Oxalobacteraceae bacterium OTU3CAMAD1]